MLNSRIVTLLAAGAMLTACGGGEAVNYGHSVTGGIPTTVGDPIVMPDGMQRDPVRDRATIPYPNQVFPDLHTVDLRVPRPRGAVLSGPTRIALHRLGDLLWVRVESPPSAMWALVQGFWQANAGVFSADPRTGEITTNAFVLNDAPVRATIVLRGGLRDGSSEVNVTVRSAVGDQERIDSSDQILELMTQFTQYLIDADRVGVGVSVAAQTLDHEQRVVIEDRVDGASSIILRLGSLRTWSSVRLAIAKGGYPLIDVSTASRWILIDTDFNESRERRGPPQAGTSTVEGAMPTLINDPEIAARAARLTVTCLAEEEQCRIEIDHARPEGLADLNDVANRLVRHL